MHESAADRPTTARRRGPLPRLRRRARSSRDLSVAIPPGKITVIVGPNACGKSTLLRGTGPAAQAEARHGAARRHVDPPAARRARSPRSSGILPQSPIAPEGITVADLVGRGRYPHQGWFRQWTAADRAAVDGALEATGTARPRRPAGRRAVRRPAPAGVDRHGARPGHRPDAARRADDLPRPRPPGRGARPARRPQPARGPHDRARAARPQPRLPLRPPPDRHARRGDRRRGRARRHRHRRAGHRRVRAAVPGDRRPGVGHADGRADRQPPPRRRRKASTRHERRIRSPSSPRCFVAHINEEHADWALVVGRAFGDLPTPSGRSSSDLDRHGVGIDGRPRPGRAPRARSVPRDAVEPAAAASVWRRTRRRGAQRQGDTAITTFEQQAAELAAIRTFVTSVVRTEEVTRGVRQITFGGGDLRRRSCRRPPTSSCTCWRRRPGRPS